MQSVEVETYLLEDSINNSDYNQFAMLAAESVSMPLHFGFYRSSFGELALDDNQDNNMKLFDVFDQLLQINYDQTMYYTLFCGVSNDFDTEPGKQHYNLLKNKLGNEFDNLFKKYLVHLLHSNRNRLSMLFEKLVLMSGCALFYDHMRKLLDECIDDLNARNINDLKDKLAIIEGIHYIKLDYYRFRKINYDKFKQILKICDLWKTARIADAITNKLPYLREDEIGDALQTVVFSNANIPSNWHILLGDENTLNIFLKRVKRNIFLGVLSSDQPIDAYFEMVSTNLNYIPHNISTKIINGKDGIIDLMIGDLTIFQKLNNKINNYDNKTEINCFECSILCFLKLNYDKFNNSDTFNLERINILKFISKGLIEFTDKTFENTNKLIQQYYFRCASIAKDIYTLICGQSTLPVEIVTGMITPYLGNPMQHYRAEKTNNSKAI